jgi:hypothetical protein
MSHMFAGGRRGIAAAAFIAVTFTGAACGNQTAPVTDVSGAGSAPKASQSSAATSADAAERRGRQQDSPASADAAERRGQQDAATSSEEWRGMPGRP